MIGQSFVRCAVLILYVLTYSFWPALKVYDRNIFYHGTAVAGALLWASSLLPVSRPDFNRRITLVGALLGFSNVVDEFFCDPTKFQWNEYAFALLIIIIVFRDYRKVNERKKLA